MTQDQLKELETFHERWCNDPPGVLRDVEIPAQVMDLLPDVIQAVRDLENCHEQDSLKTKEINILVKENRKLTAERDAALNALQQVDQCGMEHFKFSSCACAGGIKQALAHAERITGDGK